MPDARALLRAAQQAQASSSSSSSSSPTAAGIADPYASYHPKTRALRCKACNYLAIKHESLWTSHAASKSHRQAVAKARAEEEEAERRRREEIVKRKREEERVAEEEAQQQQQQSKKSRIDDGARDEEKDVDPEWELFQKEVLEAAAAEREEANVDPYAKATIEVAPQLTSGAAAGEDDAEGEVIEEQDQETEEERRARLDKEEKEEIYARFEEEQRVQDEAEERVSALKARLERLKAERASKAQSKSKAKGKAADTTA